MVSRNLSSQEKDTRLQVKEQIFPTDHGVGPGSAHCPVTKREKLRCMSPCAHHLHLCHSREARKGHIPWAHLLAVWPWAAESIPLRLSIHIHQVEEKL